MFIALVISDQMMVLRKWDILLAIAVIQHLVGLWGYRKLVRFAVW